jgi:hypothetical protein
MDFLNTFKAIDTKITRKGFPRFQRKKFSRLEKLSDSETDTENAGPTRRRQTRKKSGEKLTRSLPPLDTSMDGSITQICQEVIWTITKPKSSLNLMLSLLIFRTYDLKAFKSEVKFNFSPNVWPPYVDMLTFAFLSITY